MDLALGPSTVSALLIAFAIFSPGVVLMVLAFLEQRNHRIATASGHSWREPNAADGAVEPGESASTRKAA